MSRSPPQLRIAALLGIGAAIATACMVPYLLALKPDALGMSPIPPALAIIVSSLQTGILCFLLAWQASNSVHRSVSARRGSALGYTVVHVR